MVFEQVSFRILTGLLFKNLTRLIWSSRCLPRDSLRAIADDLVFFDIEYCLGKICLPPFLCWFQSTPRFFQCGLFPLLKGRVDRTSDLMPHIEAVCFSAHLFQFAIHTHAYAYTHAQTTHTNTHTHLRSLSPSVSVPFSLFLSLFSFLFSLFVSLFLSLSLSLFFPLTLSLSLSLSHTHAHTHTLTHFMAERDV